MGHSLGGSERICKASEKLVTEGLWGQSSKTRGEDVRSSMVSRRAFGAALRREQRGGRRVPFWGTYPAA